MSQPGFGALLHWLGGGSKHDPSEFVGKVISAASLSEDALQIAFTDGVKIKIFDNGQSCCESRYMRTDDDVQSLVGHFLRRIESKEGPEEVSEYGDTHEVVFLEIGTDSGFITIANHNEHNGYYGGFGLSIEVEAP